MMLERQREGVPKAKAAGRYKGRKPIALEFRDAVLQLASLGTTKASIARQLNLGEATVYRILAAAKAAESDSSTGTPSRESAG
jgi:DNA invertase Pin-like site-specific DNA recombinase